MPYEVVGIVSVAGFFTSIVLVVWFVAQTIKHRSSVRSEQINKLLDKFGTADEFITFAQSDAGAELMETIAGGTTSERSQVMRSVHRGVLASTLGLGGILLAWVYEYEFIWVGVLLLALGVGFLVSAYIARRIGEDQVDRSKHSLSEPVGETAG